jgi:hypothetical protein
MSSPDGQVSGMAGVRDAAVRSEPGAIPSTSRRAITSSPGGKLWAVTWTWWRMLPPDDDVIGLRQVDGMAQRPLSCRGKINATLFPHNTTAGDHS